jgi:hypothetical protein
MSAPYIAAAAGALAIGAYFGTQQAWTLAAALAVAAVIGAYQKLAAAGSKHGSADAAHRAAIVAAGQSTAAAASDAPHGDTPYHALNENKRTLTDITAKESRVIAYFTAS